MKGFIEVFNTKINKTELINIQYIQSVADNQIVLYDGGGEIPWIVYTKESYEELKQIITEAVSDE